MCKQGHTSVQILSKTPDESILVSLGTCRRLVARVSDWLVSCQEFKSYMPCSNTDLSCTSLTHKLEAFCSCYHHDCYHHCSYCYCCYYCHYHYRRHKQRQAIYMADDGQAPPLYCKASPALLWGSMYGTEHLDPSGLRKWKATAVHHTSTFISKQCLLILCNLLCGLLSACSSVTSLSLSVCNQLLTWILMQSLQGLFQSCLL
jgi:hypothetical protein